MPGNLLVIYHISPDLISSRIFCGRYYEVHFIKEKHRSVKFNDLTKVMQPGTGRPVLTKSKVTSHCYELEAIPPDVRPHWIISHLAGRITKKSELTHCVVELIFCFVSLWVLEISFKGSMNDVCLWKQICKNESFKRHSKSVSGFFCRHQKAM